MTSTKTVDDLRQVRIDTGAAPARYEMLPIAGAVMAALYPSGHAAAQGAEDSGGIEEIIVTATKRETSLQDVPQSITAFGTADIEKMVFKNMEDYMKAIPSASLVNSMPGRNSLSMRGISTGSAEYRTDSQVAVYLDEQPISSISQQPEVRMVDIARIESLPGPQGTLFGSSSQSGTLRIITNKPNHDGLSGQVEGMIGTTDGGDESWDLNGHLNIPVVEDKLALRLVAFTARDGGYVDNVFGPTFAGPGAYGSPGDNAAVAKDDQNVYDISGGRLAALWNISDNWNADIGFILQNSKATGTWETDPFLGDYKITRFFEEYRNDDWWQGSITFTGDLGFAEFVSTTSYFERDSSYEWDNMEYNQWQTSYYGPYFAPYD
ncbi:MAG: TonB-dependent receptor plug domain-containing protein, partial [Gammaproteobacteria bacterium]|nr:TonB-dependent receptor plug domain-containing protein [Gammaproteobacteria bacterium]